MHDPEKDLRIKAERRRTTGQTGAVLELILGQSISAA